MASKSVVVSMPFFINAVHSQASLSACLISIITTDIELLEVFYAHTISPVAIAVLTSVIMTIFIGRYHRAADRVVEMETGSL